MYNEERSTGLCQSERKPGYLISSVAELENVLNIIKQFFQFSVMCRGKHLDYNFQRKLFEFKIRHFFHVNHTTI